MLTRQALSNPVAVAVAILLVLLFGTISLLTMPVQMIPDVEKPSIQITTSWRAAAPEEVESEILEPQEDALRGIPGLEKMVASASQGNADIVLTFSVEASLQRALIEVINRLNQVPAYPPDANEPSIFAGRDAFGSAIAWFSVRPLEGNDRDIAGYHDFIEDVVLTRLERVDGIADARSYGGRAREVRISFDPYRAAALGIDIPTLANLTGNNRDISGGFNDVGRRQYTIRYSGKYALEEFEDMVVDWGEGSPVRLGDIATVDVELRDSSGTLSQNGAPSIAVNAQPEKGVNVIDVMQEIEVAVTELREGPLQRAGLLMEQVYDETTYITDSIAMLRTNLLLGITLAIGILWWFLRRLRATFIVALSIPISLFVAFVVLGTTGRTLNMISLAGLAFAVGLVMDAAIIVLENIVRLKEKGLSNEEAAFRGANDVWGALLASTATTVIIFLPIVFLRDVAAQLFADLALAISAAVIASLAIAMAVIPAASKTWLKDQALSDPHQAWWERGTRIIMDLTGNARRRYAWIAALVLGSATISLALLPQTDYLPEGKQNFIFGFVQTPPGMSVQSGRTEMVDVINERMRPFINGERQPGMHMYFLGIFGNFGFVGGRAEDADSVDELVGSLSREVMAGFPDTLIFLSRAALFRRYEGSREIDVNIQGTDIETVLRAAQAGFGAVMQALPGATVRPVPGLQLAEPELRLVPDERRIAEAGWNRRAVADVVRSLSDGLYVGDYFDGERELDIVLRGSSWTNPEELAAMPVATPAGGVQPLGELIKFERTAGPDQIRRVDRRRTITLLVRPPEGMALGPAIDILKEKVEPVIRSQLPGDGDVTYQGTADNKDRALANMARSFALAIVVLYLLMSALFRSFKDALIAVLALPLATVGGVISLRIVDALTFQPMDLLTVVGFVILLGLVVNNAILLVHRTRAAERSGVERREAVEEAVRIRLRPILMSTLTSLFGMLPLLLIPGPGSELYRGLAAVIVGGMSVSTLFTLVLLPSLLRIGESHPSPRADWSGGETRYAKGYRAD